MREKLVGLLAAALMCVCGVASANITYTVDLSGNGETVTGTITTDGASGQLSAANVLSWSLSGSGDLTFSLDKSLPSSSVACGVGCGLDANGSELEFVGSDTGYADYFELAHGGVAAEFTSTDLFYHDPLFGLVAIPLSAPYTIGRVSVPEPPTAPLLGLGLACLGLACTRTRRRPSAAV